MTGIAVGVYVAISASEAGVMRARSAAIRAFGR